MQLRHLMPGAAAVCPNPPPQKKKRKPLQVGQPTHVFLQNARRPKKRDRDRDRKRQAAWKPGSKLKVHTSSVLVLKLLLGRRSRNHFNLTAKDATKRANPCCSSGKETLSITLHLIEPSYPMIAASSPEIVKATITIPPLRLVESNCLSTCQGWDRYT